MLVVDCGMTKMRLQPVGMADSMRNFGDKCPKCIQTHEPSYEFMHSSLCPINLANGHIHKFAG